MMSRGKRSDEDIRRNCGICCSYHVDRHPPISSFEETIMRKKPIIESVDQAVCRNCIYSYQQHASFQDASEVEITVCAHSKHQNHNHDFCQDGSWLVKHRKDGTATTAGNYGVYYIDDVYEVLEQ